MKSDFPTMSDFDSPFPITDTLLSELNNSALENCLQIEKPGCFLKYYGLLAMRLANKGYYSLAFSSAEKGMQMSFQLYKELYPDSANGYFDNSLSPFSFEYALLQYGGKASEKSCSPEATAYFYENYMRNGHWVHSIVFAGKQAAKFFKKIGNDGKAIDCLEYVLKNIRVSSVTKAFFEKEIARLKEIKEIDWVNDITIFIKDYSELARANEYPLSLSKIDYEEPELKVSHYFLQKGKNVFKTENVFWWALQSLLYYEEIFAEIPQQTFKNYQEINCIPSDFFQGGEFYKRREKMLKEKNAKLLKLSLESEIGRRFEDYKNKNIRHLVIDKITKEGLLELTKAVPAMAIVSICDRINQDNCSNRSGLPDLIVYDNAYTSFQFIEVKKMRENLRFHQELWLDFLRKNNINATICRVS